MRNLLAALILFTAFLTGFTCSKHMPMAAETPVTGSPITTTPDTVMPSTTIP